MAAALVSQRVLQVWLLRTQVNETLLKTVLKNMQRRIKRANRKIY